MDLLVSVRNAIEAAVVAKHQVAIIDIKEPANGSLGMADPAVVTEVLRELPVDQAVSLALGELADLTPDIVQNYFSRCETPQTTIYAKVGLAGMNSTENWQAKWADVFNSTPGNVAHVVVAYADHKLAKSPPLNVVLKATATHHCQAVLLDTFSKNAGSSLDHVRIEELLQLSKWTNANAMKFVMAGSITINDLHTIRDLKIDIVGVRGAVCEAGVRTSSISEDRLVKFLSKLSEFSNHESARI